MSEVSRRSLYLLLIAVSTGSILGRILAVNSVDAIQLEKRLEKEHRRDWRKQRPFLSANDRSRWCTVRSLVEQGTYAIDEIVSQNPDKVADAKTNPKAIGWFVGEVMKASDGKANPQAVNDLLRKKLGN